MMRTDRHNNPTAFTTELAKQAGLVFNVDYVNGDTFKVGAAFYNTATILKDPIEVTIRLIDKVGFYTRTGQLRWIYIAIPPFIWNSLDKDEKRKVIGFMYKHEGGISLKKLFE